MFKANIEQVLFLDIETVPLVWDYTRLDPRLQAQWERKSDVLQRNAQTAVSPADFFKEKAGIYSEFAKIVCISCGMFRKEDGVQQFRVKTFAGHNEKELLLDFAELLNKSFTSPEKRLCAHNGKEFDFPVLARRMMINGVIIPATLNIQGKKPWEVLHYDTLEMWKFGDIKNYTSLELLAAVFQIPTPKDDIDGSQVGRVYWEENDLPRITQYCQKDVITLARLFQRFCYIPFIRDEDIFIV